MSATFHFDGFQLPHYTQIPDEAFDYLMPRLSGSEWKVLCYIMRRTFGFQKSSDDISLSQLVDGIRSRDGESLDSGTGLDRKTVVNALKKLEEVGVITAQRNFSQEKGNEATTYRLRFRAP